MDKELIERLATNPNFIAGIYNYCDRWCERCPFTSRCLNFALGEEQFADPEAHDINNEAFWQKLTETLQVTLDMLKEIVEQEGVDLDSLDAEEAVEEEWLNEEIAANHECARAAAVYGEMVDNWFDSAKSLFEEKENELDLKVRLAIPNTDPFQQAASLKDSVETICWYQHLIWVKIMRALEEDLRGRPEVLDGLPRDSDGSAKVALIAIDRSMAAWGAMRNHFPKQEDTILDLLVHLDRLRRKVEKTFPDARAFVRPGFDTTS